MRTSQANRLLRAAACLDLAAIALMTWGCLDSRPIALVIAMSVGQGLGTLALAGFLFVVVADVRHVRVLSALARRFSSGPPRNPPSED